MSNRPKQRTKKPSKHTESIFHRDIKDLEIGKNLRRLGNIRITEWEFRDILPAVNRVAQTEIDIDGFVRRAANYRVTEWDLKDLLGRRERRTRRPPPSPAEMLKLSNELTRFIRFVTRNLIDQSDMAEIRTNQPFPDTLMIKLVLCQRDAAAIIGHGGHTAAAIRGMIKNVARKRGARASLRILSFEEDAEEA
ncbi:MAG: KH domain-containing protein [Luteolibacter sp.]|jgi:predicted RNA-binding protein YlqC (UPF0109 family)